jgi:hypothetical protein
MIFTPELAQKVLAGEKTVTRRRVSRNSRSPWFIDKCTLQVGRTYAVCPGRAKVSIGRVRVLSVERMHLGQGLTTAEARREGFEDRGAFKRAWTAINGRWSDGDLVWRIEFEFVEDA